VIIRPVSPGLEATTPLLTKNGQMFLIRLKSQETAGILACTWELPTVQVLTPPGTAASMPKGPTIDLARLHTQYKMESGKGAVSWMPAEVYDDANSTIVRFTESLAYTAAPILLAVSADGKKTIPLEYTTYSVPGRQDKGLFYITRGIYPRLQLRDGNGGVVTIVRQPTPAPIYTQVDHP
jgi:type IV secretory pathway VirB9-like protein